MNIIKFNELISNEKSNWDQDANFRNDNRYWLVNSKKVALKILRRIREQNISKELLSYKTGIPMEILQTMLKGEYNYSIEEIGRIEKALNINILNNL
jgi:ribosome-binding protein aMBF1 (putative translation factor)